MQDKKAEADFFNAHAARDSYDVFAPVAKDRIIDSFVRLTGLQRGARVLDLGCGSGAFTELLRNRGYTAHGVDIASDLISLGRRRYPHVEFSVGDIEDLPYSNGSFDGALLSGIVHHFQDPSKCLAELKRVLRPGGRFMAFDPNRMNPFFYLYRDPTSPLYSSVGVTKNERPVLARQIVDQFRAAGLAASTDYLGSLPYRYVASNMARRVLFAYNAIDCAISFPTALRPIRPFVLTYGGSI